MACTSFIVVLGFHTIKQIIIFIREEATSALAGFYGIRPELENQWQVQPTYGTGLESNSGHIGGRRELSHHSHYSPYLPPSPSPPPKADDTLYSPNLSAW